MTQNFEYRTEMEQWMDMWDEAQTKGVSPKIEPPQPAQYSGDLPQDTYYDYLDNAGLFQEEKTPNPVYPDSVGPDHATTKPVWASEDLLKEIEQLKNKMFEVENRLAQMGGGKKWSEKAELPDEGKKLFGEIDSLKKRIEKVSSVLGTKDEPSPWVVKRD